MKELNNLKTLNNTDSLVQQNVTLNSFPPQHSSPQPSISISTTTMTITSEDVPQQVQNTQETSMTVAISNGPPVVQKKSLMIHIKEEVLQKVRENEQAHNNNMLLKTSSSVVESSTNKVTPTNPASTLSHVRNVPEKTSTTNPALTSTLLQRRRQKQVTDEDNKEEEEQATMETSRRVNQQIPLTTTPPKQEDEDDEDTANNTEEDDGKIYCICKTLYNPNLWMIACDICNEWFHGKCVQITANEARKIQTYACPFCQEKGIPIVYKNAGKKRTKSRSASPIEQQQNSSRPSTPSVKNEDENDTMHAEALLLCSEIVIERPANTIVQQQQQASVKNENHSFSKPPIPPPSSTVQNPVKKSVSAAPNGPRQRKRKKITDDDDDVDEPPAKKLKESSLDLLADSCTLEANARSNEAVSQKPPLYRDANQANSVL